MENESLPAENETEKLKKEGKIQKLKCYLVALSNVINSERTRCCLIVSFIIFHVRTDLLTDMILTKTLTYGNELVVANGPVTSKCNDAME